jgi:hypothetical protein
MKWRIDKMFKKIGLPAIALLGIPAKAAERFGVRVRAVRKL